jgi:hypothetical protein
VRESRRDDDERKIGPLYCYTIPGALSGELQVEMTHCVVLNEKVKKDGSLRSGGGECSLVSNLS